LVEDVPGVTDQLALRPPRDGVELQLLLEARRLRPLEDDLPAPLLIGLKIEGVLGGRIRKD